MSQLFPRSANTLGRMVLPGLVLGVTALAWATHSALFSPYATVVGVEVRQPVPFSHKHHVGELGIDCRYCHGGVETSAFAGMPATETCMTCHSQIWRDAPMLEPVRKSWQTGRPLHWTRVNDLPDYVYFDHSIHVSKGVACVSCHGRLDQMQLTAKAHDLYMRWCLDCHRTPDHHTRPASQIFVMADLPAMKQAPAMHGTRMEDCSLCHR